MATIRQCRRALELHEQELSCIETVVGLGVVPASESPRGGGEQDMAVAVYVTRMPRRNEIESGKPIPEKLVVKGRQGAIEIPTRVIQTGEFVAESEFKRT